MKKGDTLYFDYQATTPPDPKVLEKMRPWLDESFGNPHSVDHILGWQAAQAVESAATSVATLIGTDPDEIVFTSGATEANNLALLGIGRRAAGGKRRRILVGATEHKSVLAPCRVLEAQCGYQIEYLPVDHEGFLTVEALQETIADDVLLISFMAVNNEIGTIQPICDIAHVAHTHGAIFHCDAAQGPCGMDVSSLSTHADLISLSGHKMYGPKGVGALRIRRNLNDSIEPLIYGGGQQRDVRSGTIPVPLCVGMAAAADLLQEISAKSERDLIRELSEGFLNRLRNTDIPFKVNGSPSAHRHPGNLNIRFDGIDAHELLGALQPYLAASTGSACTTGTPEPSHVLQAIGLSNAEAESSVRFSLGRFTNESQISEAVQHIQSVFVRLSDPTSLAV